MKDLDELKDRTEHSVFDAIRNVTFLERLHKTITTGLMIVVFAMMSSIYWIVERPPSLSYGRMPFKVVEEKIYFPNDVVPVVVIRCSTKDSTSIYTVTRGFHNLGTDRTEIVNSTKVTVKPGCTEAISYLHQLPKEVAPGKYKIVGTAEVPDMFGIKLVSFESEPFEVR